MVGCHGRHAERRLGEPVRRGHGRRAESGVGERSGAVQARRCGLPAARQARARSRVSCSSSNRYKDMFVRAGAKLSDADKATLKALNEQISAQHAVPPEACSRRPRTARSCVDDEKQLDGLAPEQISAAAEAAKARGLTGKWVITLQNTTTQPALEQLTNRALRQKRVRGVGRPRPRRRRTTRTEIVTKLAHAARPEGQAARLHGLRRLRARRGDRADAGGRQQDPRPGRAGRARKAKARRPRSRR